MCKLERCPNEEGGFMLCVSCPYDGWDDSDYVDCDDYDGCDDYDDFDLYDFDLL